MATEQNGGGFAASQPETDGISAICSDLETARCKVNSMVGALGILAEGDDAPLFYTLLNAIEPADMELERIINRLAALERNGAPAWAATEAADPDFYRRTFEEWSAALAECDGNPGPASDREEGLYNQMVKNNATTAGDAAMKLRVILHTLFVADFPSNNPTPSAALSSLLADLERIDAAADFARRAGKAVAS